MTTIENQLEKYRKVLVYNPHSRFNHATDSWVESYRTELEFQAKREIAPAKDKFELMDKVAYFAYNYNELFLLKAFIDDPSMANHFQSKFEVFCDQVGSSFHGFFKLYLAMNETYRKVLVEYIDRTYHHSLSGIKQLEV